MTPAKQINAFLAKYPPAIAKQARACLGKLRKRLPDSVEMVYDYRKSLVFTFGSTERGYEGVFSLVLARDSVSLAFNYFKDLPDPEKRLRGGGKQVRHVDLDSPASLDDPYVVALMEAALARAKVAMDPKAKRKLIIKSTSANRA